MLFITYIFIIYIFYFSFDIILGFFSQSEFFFILWLLDIFDILPCRKVTVNTCAICKGAYGAFSPQIIFPEICNYYLFFVPEMYIMKGEAMGTAPSTAQFIEI